MGLSGEVTAESQLSAQSVQIAPCGPHASRHSGSWGAVPLRNRTGMGLGASGCRLSRPRPLCRVEYGTLSPSDSRAAEARRRRTQGIRRAQVRANNDSPSRRPRARSSGAFALRVQAARRRTGGAARNRSRIAVACGRTVMDSLVASDESIRKSADYGSDYRGDPKQPQLRYCPASNIKGNSGATSGVHRRVGDGNANQMN